MKKTAGFSLVLIMIFSAFMWVSCKTDERNGTLDALFNTDELGTITLKVQQDQWDTLLSNYDTNAANDEYVKADFSMIKGNGTYELSNVGFRIRGNTSRIRPQEKISDTENGGFRQAHFKVDFNEFNASGEDDRTLADGIKIKALNLKRFKCDGDYCREVFCYNYMRECGVWSAPRACYTRLFIDLVQTDGTTKSLDYGVYAMIENVDKMFLKDRTTKKGNGTLTGNDGNLWKCSYPADLEDNSQNYFGVSHTDLDSSKSTSYRYDLKTNKSNLTGAANQFRTFMYGLYTLTFDGKTAGDKLYWLDSNCDIDLFLKAMALDVVLGMDDDYWGNMNNFYFYFDETNGKGYFIPYDYDNSLGSSVKSDDPAVRNPYAWGSYSPRLISVALSVPKYKEAFTSYIKQFSDSSSGFDYEAATARIKKWQNMILPYINSPDLVYYDTTNTIEDKIASWCSCKNHYLLTGDVSTNWFKAKQNAIALKLGSGGTAIETVNLCVSANIGGFILYNGSEYTGGFGNTFNVGDSIDEWLASEHKYVSKYGYEFSGWYTAREGGEVVTAARSFDGDIIKMDKEYIYVYAHYNQWTDEQKSAVPYTSSYDEDNDVYTLSFVFDPEQFGNPSFSTVVVRGPGKDWSKNVVVLEKDEDDGLYKGTYSVSSSERENIGFTYKFVLDIADGSWNGTWLGPKNYEPYKNKKMPVYTYENTEDPNFIFTTGA